MASTTVPKSVCLAKPGRPPHLTASGKSPSHLCLPSIGLFGSGHHTWKLVFDLREGRNITRVGRCTWRGLRLNCSSNANENENFSSASSSSDDDRDVDEQQPPQEAVLKAISEVSKTEGRVGQTTNVIIGGTVADDSTNEWLALDQKVNSYPTVRGFTAIGTGGDDFVQSMIIAVESVLQRPIPEGRIKQKLSSRGKYVSVNIGPLRVSSSEQVQAVYNAMRRDDRMKYFL